MIDLAKQSPIKMLAPLRFKIGVKVGGLEMPKSQGGFWQISQRFDIDKKGGFAKVVRIMTCNPEEEPIGEFFILPYGMVCGSMEQLTIMPA